MNLNKMNIVLDCANGSAYRVAPLIFRELGAQVYVYGNAPDGTNINERSGALHPENVQKAVIDHRADVGIALDGDGDRIIMVDEHAQIVNGDMLLAICAKDMKERGELKNNKVVATIMSNFGFLKAMEHENIEVIQTQVGDRYVIQAMRDHDANLGGEQSGHLIFLDHNTTGDGLVSALQVLRIMKETDKSLSELTTFVTQYPQVVLNVKITAKPPLESLQEVQREMKRIEEQLKGRGRVLVRYSGTEMVCRVMLEGPNHKEVQEMANRIAEKIKQAIGT